MHTSELGIESIVADRSWNLRENYGNIDNLAKDIKRDGQMTPVVVRPVGMSKGKAKFQLIAGYRRFLALQKIGSGVIMATVLDENLDEKEARLHNLKENMQRKNLTSYELAKGFADLKNTHGMSLKQIGSTLGSGTEGFSKGYVSKMINAYERLISEIKNVWKDSDHPANGLCTVNNLERIYGLPTEDQAVAWENLVNPVDEYEESGEGEEREPRTSNSRPSVAVLRQAMDAVADQLAEEKISEDVAVCVMSTLKFAVGDNKSISVSGERVFVPKRKKSEG